jgi:hypothetical protein
MTPITLASTQNLLFNVTLEQITVSDYRVHVTAFDKRFKHREKSFDYGNLSEAYRIYGAYVEDLVSRERTLIRQDKSALEEVESGTKQLWREKQQNQHNVSDGVTLAY